MTTEPSMDNYQKPKTSPKYVICSLAQLVNEMGLALSKIVQKWKHETQNSEPTDGYIIPSVVRKRYFDLCVPLHRAALKGDWETAKELLKKDPNLVRDSIAEGGLTALHIAAAKGQTDFVKNLLEHMKRPDLEIMNNNETTALSIAAGAGHDRIVELMVKKNPDLPKIRGTNGFTPLYMAVWHKHKKMVEYLLNVSDFKSWSRKDQIEILTTSIYLGLYAVKIVKQDETLATADHNGETPLQVLASMPLAFSGTRQGFWGNVASTILSYMTLKAWNTSAQCEAYTLLDCLWRYTICQEDVEAAQLPARISNLLFVAANSGNDDFLVELIKRYPDFICKVNSSNYSILHIAVRHRHVKIFNLIYELHGVKDLLMSFVDNDHNNILHLAAMLAPENQLNSIPGAALQMQWEVLWYKEVEKIVHPSFRDMKNKTGQTPYQLFLKKHKSLMEEGERQMKQIAKSCMLVAMLIATIVFTTAFTVPGGYDNNTGAPILKNKKLFMVFPISEAIATLASLISMLTFLSVLTSRYSDSDFLRTLPSWLVVGVATLFV